MIHFMLKDDAQTWCVLRYFGYLNAICNPYTYLPDFYDTSKFDQREKNENV